jgi:hypothetical protein
MRDPITGRDISPQCWNGHHEELVYYPGYGTEQIGCDEKHLCGCLCHPRNQVAAPLLVIPAIEEVCTYCFGTGEVPTNSTNYISCPKCSTASRPKETNA